jgi:AcrR family transcriptional regulator
MQPETDPRKPSAARGRPRSEHARRAVMDAALSLVEEGGYPAATIEEIAARSGVAKTTIYRWWPSRPALIVDLLLQIAAVAAPPPAGPDAMRALRTELSRIAKSVAALPGRLLVSLASEGQNDPEVRIALKKGLFQPRRKATAKVVRQAQASGALRGDVPPDVIIDLLYGPIFYRRLLRQEPATDAFVRQVFENAMAGLRPRSGGRKVARSATARSSNRPTRR